MELDDACRLLKPLDNGPEAIAQALSIVYGNWTPELDRALRFGEKQYLEEEHLDEFDQSLYATNSRRLWKRSRDLLRISRITWLNPEIQISIATHNVEGYAVALLYNLFSDDRLNKLVSRTDNRYLVSKAALRVVSQSDLVQDRNTTTWEVFIHIIKRLYIYERNTGKSLLC